MSDTGVPERFVACLDVLGFSQAVKSDLETLFNAYKTATYLIGKNQESGKFIQKVLGVKNIDGSPPDGYFQKDFESIFNVAIFSDSIFIFTCDTSEASLIQLCEFCCFVYRDFLRQGLMLRGGISKGQAIVFPEENLYLGQGIVNAWLIEKELDMSGIVLDEGLECAASSICKVAFKNRPNAERHVPRHRSMSFTGQDYIRQFKLARMKAGSHFEQRYKNSEPAVALMMKIDPMLFGTPI